MILLTFTGDAGIRPFSILRSVENQCLVLDGYVVTLPFRVHHYTRGAIPFFLVEGVFRAVKRANMVSKVDRG